MSKAEFLKRMRTARIALDDAVSGLTEDQITYDIVAGEWTVKDVLAHLGAWENEAALMVERAARGEDEGPGIAESVDEWNARRVSERRRLPLVEVMQEFNDARDRLLAALEEWPDDSAPLGPDGWDESARLWWLTEHDFEHLGAVQIYRARLENPQPA
ncbi:MAG TPA: maleylpyruvate isomerase N-terminal domain-containing protein [Ktedonobacterales bacterium]|nr:maleylpyruvate isomerase N-terminal domain-containing protein [Ktedonobacterales bacterium]